VVCGLVGGKLEEESKGDPRFHVRGATKIYRRACWQKIGGLIRVSVRRIVVSLSESYTCQKLFTQVLANLCKLPLTPMRC